MQTVEGPALHEGLHDLPIHPSAIDPGREVVEVLEIPARLPGLQDRLDGAFAHVLHTRQPEADALAHHREVLGRLVDGGRERLDSLGVGMSDVARELVVVGCLGGQQRGKILPRMVGLQIRGLVRDQRVGRGVGFREAIARELRHQLEDLVGLGSIDPPLRRTLDEALLLARHLLGLLLPHGPTQHVGFSQAVARQSVGDLQHLVLVDDHAQCLGGEFFELGEQVLDGPFPVLSRDVVIHHARAQGTGPVEGDDGDELLERGGVQLHHQVRHSRRFHLEDPLGVPGGEHLVGGGIFVGDAVDAKIGVDGFAHTLFGRRNGGERAQAQEIELDEAHLLHAPHVELAHHFARSGVAVEGDGLDQRAGADHHPRRVDGCVTRETLQAARSGEQLGDLAVRIHARPQFLALLQGLVEADPQRLGDQLGNAIHGAVGHAQHAPHIAHGSPRLQLPEGDDLGDALAVVSLAVVLLRHVADHLLASVHAEVHVDVRHADALWVQEALEDDVVLDGVDPGDAEAVRRQATRRGTPPGPHRDVVLARVLDEVGHDQEVTREAHAVDDAELVVHPLPVFRKFLGKGLLAIHQQALAQSPPGLFGEHLLAAPARRHLELGHVVIPAVQVEIQAAALRDLQAVGHRRGMVAEQLRHLVPVLDVEAPSVEAKTLGIVEIRTRTDAEQRVVVGVIIALQVVGVVGGEQRQPQVAGHLHQLGVHHILVIDAVALQLQVVAIAKDGREVLHEPPSGIQLATRDGARHQGGEAA